MEDWVSSFEQLASENNFELWENKFFNVFIYRHFTDFPQIKLILNNYSNSLQSQIEKQTNFKPNEKEKILLVLNKMINKIDIDNEDNLFILKQLPTLSELYSPEFQNLFMHFYYESCQKFFINLNISNLPCNEDFYKFILQSLEKVEKIEIKPTV